MSQTSPELTTKDKADLSPKATKNKGDKKDLGAKVKNLEAENAALKDEYMRALAELENLKKRHVREKEDALKYGLNSLLKDVLPVADNIKRALCVAPAADDAPAFKSLFEGVRLIEKEVARFLDAQGVKPLSSKGQMFDPNHHEAMREVCDSTKKPGEIVDVIQEGYLLNDRLLRPALVVVNQKVNAEDEEAESDDVDSKDTKAAQDENVNKTEEV